MPRSIYRLRHGETLFNVHNKTQRWCNSPLTERGIEQCKIAGKTLAERGIVFDKYYSSTFERCCDTLELAMEAGWGEVYGYQRMKGLKEMNFGVFEAKDQFLERFPHGDFYASYGGESERECLARFKSTISSIMEQCNDGERVLATTHGGVCIMLFLDLVVGSTPHDIPFGNCICFHYEYDDGKFTWVETIVPEFGKLNEGVPKRPQNID